MPLSPGGIAAVILAAGAGSRLGGGKLLLPWRGKPIIVHAAETAAAVSAFHSLTVVTGSHAPEVAAALARHLPGAPLHLAENTRWREGMSTSLRLGLESALSRTDGEDVAGVMFLLGDQPLVRRETLGALLRAHGEAADRNPGHPATAPLYAGRRGNPVILSRRLFPGIMALRGDVGARSILAAQGEGVLLVPVDDPGVRFDVDSPEAYERLNTPEGFSPNTFPDLFGR